MKVGRRFKIFFLSLCFSLVASCAPKMTRYEYISLKQQNDLKVTKFSKYTQFKTISHESMPVKYQIMRDRYSISFEVLLNTYTKNIEIKAYSENEFYEIVDSREASYCGFFSEAKTIFKESTFTYSNGPSCNSKNKNISVSKKVIKFYIKNNDEILGEEMFEFEIKKNGFYLSLDAV